ncbi:MAG: single-stranded DNA-binding protein [Chthonomonadales bacterium]|nr:single-stranded DNA-binding protein [Chthonomonadales bacterium]
MLNRIVLIGRLTQDPESSYTPSGVALAKFRLAVDRPTKNAETGEKETDFINIVAFRRSAEFVSQYITKGRLVAVEGRLQIRSWVAQDGSRRNWTEVIADNVQGLDRPRDTDAAPPEQGGHEGARGPDNEKPAPRAAAAANDADDSDPFADE